MIILIDNYDSFTWNLYHFLGDLGQKVRVFRNDKVNIDKLIDLKPKGFVISPGPGEPTSAGISVDLVRTCVDSKIPLLGVCLGHQAIAYALNGKFPFLSINGKEGNVSRVPPSMYIKPSCIYDENMNGIAILIHNASITFISPL